MIRTICLAVMLAGPAAAQTQITPDAFLNRAGTQTLTFEFYPYGGLVGVEQFLSRKRTVWATPTGTCTYGDVEVRGPQVCFTYPDLEDPEHCWVPFDQNGLIVLMSPEMDMQKVTGYGSRPVICEDVPIS